jgi:type VI secretion system secreted protein Hcp
MAIDAYMTFVPYNAPPSGPGPGLMSESQVDMSQNNENLASQGPVSFKSAATNGQLFEIEDYSFDVEQTLNIGSQSTGAGAGRITFNPFSITRKIDKQSPIFFNMACSGTAFKFVSLGLRKSSGGVTAGQIFLRFDFKLVAVKTISWAHDDESPKETITFEYGGLWVSYNQQAASGAMTAAAVQQGWSRVTNTADSNWTAPITSGG